MTLNWKHLAAVFAVTCWLGAPMSVVAQNETNRVEVDENQQLYDEEWYDWSDWWDDDEFQQQPYGSTDWYDDDYYSDYGYDGYGYDNNVYNDDYGYDSDVYYDGYGYYTNDWYDSDFDSWYDGNRFDY